MNKRPHTHTLSLALFSVLYMDSISGATFCALAYILCACHCVCVSTQKRNMFLIFGNHNNQAKLKKDVFSEGPLASLYDTW